VFIKAIPKLHDGGAKLQSKEMPTRSALLVAFFAEDFGAKQSHSEALRWFRKAAEQGHTKAKQKHQAI